MEARRSLSGISLVCPHCKNSLDEERDLLKCGTCLRQYTISGGIPCMLANQALYSGEQLEVEVSTRKEAVRSMFNTINHSLEQNGLSRFSTFINWGYADLEEGLKLQGVNDSSRRLFHEVIGNVDPTGLDVLEIACGRGGNIKTLFKNYKPRSVMGLDLTESNIAFCHQSNNHEQAYFCIGDAEQLPFQAESVDIVMNIESSDLYPRINKFFDEVYRVLKPGAKFLYADDLDTLKFEQCEQYLRSLGFRILINRDISENVLRSSEQALQIRLASLNSSVEKDGQILGTMGVPGTKIFEDMRAGGRKYKILQLIK